MSNIFFDELQIKYTKLHFVLGFDGYSVLPIQKASAIRGGIGEMLLRANCINNRECENCDFVKECIVQRTMYSQFDTKPGYVTTGESIGYVIECEDYREEFDDGDTLEFNLILFGKTIVYFNQYLQAVYALGRSGLGKNGASFEVLQVLNTFKEPIIDGFNVYMGKYSISTLGDYVAHRRNQLHADTADGKYDVTLKFKTALSTKYMNEELKEFIPEAVLGAVCRRLETIDAFENIDGSAWKECVKEALSMGEMEYVQSSKQVSIPRFSFRKQQKMHLRGIIGSITIKKVPEDILTMLIAGEITHAGKNTSFGMGRYRIDGIH